MNNNNNDDRPSRPPLRPQTASTSTLTVNRSARYPRVAVLLGVERHWFVPLLACRSLSTVSAWWWAGHALFCLYRVLAQDVDGRTPWSWGLVAPVLYDRVSTFEGRLMAVQVVLAFIWAVTAAYLAHLLASSLMSRWLLHYSPAAVLVRLCSLSILLSYGCAQVFRLTGALRPDLEALSRSLPVWVTISVGLLLLYFVTQQDISVEEDKDDRKRRSVLRLKCLYAMAGCSLLSLFSLLAVIHLDPVDLSSKATEWWRNLGPLWENVLSIGGFGVRAEL